MYHPRQNLYNQNRQDCETRENKSHLYPQMNLTLCSDSQGSQMASQIEMLSSKRISVFGYVRPNTTLMQVLESSTIEDKNPLIILGGTNDSLKGSLEEIYKHLEEKLISICKKRPVFITTVPIRYDEPLDDPVNTDIEALNSYISELAFRINNMCLISLNHLKRYHYTKNGIHFNELGKEELAHVILNTVTAWHSKLQSSHGTLSSELMKTSADTAFATNITTTVNAFNGLNLSNEPVSSVATVSCAGSPSNRSHLNDVPSLSTSAGLSALMFNGGGSVRVQVGGQNNDGSLSVRPAGNHLPNYFMEVAENHMM